MHTDALRGRDLLTIADLTPEEFVQVLDVAADQKAQWAAGVRKRPLEGKSVAIVLQKASLRTRISFEVACVRLGAHPVVMAGAEGAFSRGESIHDTAKVMERYVDAVVIRTYEQSLLKEFATAASAPVINALSDDHHPCQGLADFLTIRENLGELQGRRFAYVGDGNNMAHTYLLSGALAGMNVVVATPDAYRPSSEIVQQATGIAARTGGSVEITSDPAAAVLGADVVATDTWASMGQEAEHAERVGVFEPYRVDDDLMSRASSSAIFLHCLPAHRGEEVTDSVLDGPQSMVFDEAENRLHAQQALLSLVV